MTVRGPSGGTWWARRWKREPPPRQKVNVMKVEEYRETRLEMAGWPVNLSSYRLGNTWHCKADNVSPGAALARTTGASREEAEKKALDRAEQLLTRTRVH